jgi:hypothetical protein
MAPFEEVVVALLEGVKVDRQNMPALLVEEQTYLLLILVVLLQEEAITLAAILQVAELALALVLVP